MSKTRYTLSRSTLIEISNYLGNQIYREVSNLLSALDLDLRQENELSEKPLEYYNVSGTMLSNLKKYLSTKPYGEVYKFMYELETAVCVPSLVNEDASRLDEHKDSATSQVSGESEGGSSE